MWVVDAQGNLTWKPYSGILDSSDVEISVDKGAWASGRYTDVYCGMYKGQPAAFKAVRKPYRFDVDPEIDEREYEKEDIKIIERTGIWWGLRHDNILDVHGFIADGELSRFKVVVTPWYENGNLADFMEKNPKLEMSKRVALFLGVANGLDYLHTPHFWKTKIVHGSLNPINVLIDHDCIPKLCDFVLSRLFNNKSLTSAKTMRYMAPEIVSSGLDWPVQTTFSDVYALGCLGLEILTSVKPYENINASGFTERNLLKSEITSGRLPARCPSNCYGLAKKTWTEVLEASWKRVAEKRPSTRQICVFLIFYQTVLKEFGRFPVEEPEIPIRERTKPPLPLPSPRVSNWGGQDAHKGGHTHRFTFMNSSSQVNLSDPTTLFTRDSLVSNATSYYTAFSRPSHASSFGAPNVDSAGIPEGDEFEE